MPWYGCAREVERMRRRWFRYALVIGFVAALGCALLFWYWLEKMGGKARFRVEAYSHPPAISEPAEGPNVIVFVIDATRLDALSPYGGVPDERTPNIAKLAEQGVVFESAYTVASFSGPSYASIITGKYPLSHGVLDHPNELPEANHTLLEAAADAGYYTLHITQHGFLRNRWNYDQGAAFYRFSKNYNTLISHLNSWIVRNRETPFVAFVAITAPHFPYTPWKFRQRRIQALSRKERLIARTISKRSLKYDFAATGLSEDYVAAQREYYQLEVDIADQLLGRVMDAVERSGRRENTAFIVTADHGEAFGEHGLHFIHDAVVYAPVSRVPLIVSWPGHIAPGRVTSIVSLIDLLPTVAEWIGGTADEEMDGRSLAPLLDGGSIQEDRTVICYSRPRWKDGKEFPVLGAKYQLPGFVGSSLLGARGRWDVVLQPLTDGFALEVFDRAEDPLHLADLAGEQGEHSEVEGIVAELHHYRDRLLAATLKESELSEEQLQGLRELGYIE
jgi:choline-sulfatase